MTAFAHPCWQGYVFGLLLGVILALDLLEPFSLSFERLYFAVDGHFNAAGHRYVAKLLADWLHQTALLKDS